MLPPGEFSIGSDRDDEVAHADERPRHAVELEPFRISRYPVTVEQYRAFVGDGGYTERRRSCWTKAGWRWREKEEVVGPRSYDGPFDVPNQPQVGVSWYEAFAFCRWLSEQTGRTVRLPSEAEWERAARGEEGRRYPWGDGWDETRCNHSKLELGSPSPVGMFPAGATPEGVDDLAGNVWEWCQTKWRSNYEKEADESEEGDAARVFRGGSWFHDRRLVRAAYRHRRLPASRNGNWGFRVVSAV